MTTEPTRHRRNLGIILILVFIPLVILIGSVLLLRDQILANSLPPEPALQTVIDADFDAALDETVWSLPEGWTYTTALPNLADSGGLSAEGEPAPLTVGQPPYQDVVVEVRLSVTAGECRVTTRRNGTAGYTLGLKANNELALYRSGELLDTAFVDDVLAGPPYHRLRLSTIDNVLHVMADGEEAITLLDPDGALPTGAVVLDVVGAPPTGCLIDSLRLSEPVPAG